jgi:hypothetical protein
MAEITVKYYDPYGDTSLGTVTISPRGNGYEWTKTGNHGSIEKVYCPTFKLKELSVVLPRYESALVGGKLVERGGSYFRNILTNPSDGKPIYFTKTDALKLYGFFAEQMEWSPDALASGTAHPELLAAQARHSTRGGGSRRARRARRVRGTRRL